MELKSEGIHYDSKSGIHWTRITVKLDNGEATVLVCAARNYIADEYHAEGAATNEHLEQWLSSVLQDLKESNQELTAGEVYKKVYAHNLEGENRGLRFLKEEIAP